MAHKNNIVKKPWGYEYLAYENQKVALWLLYIKPNHQTSMHCHPLKTTGLTLLDGEAEVSFLSSTHPMRSHHKMMIRNGLFHSTKAIDPRGAWVFEIEAPVNKNDLVRLRDSYGRQGKPYEDETFEYPKEDDCLWIENPEPSLPRTYHIANSKLVVTKVETVDFFKKVKPHQNVMVLDGGILTEYGANVVPPGSIISAHVLDEIVDVFTRVADNTIVMIMEPE